MPIGIVSRSEKQTATLAAGLARLLEPGDVVFLKGPLGSGKSFFIRAAARELGVPEPITSPSYTLGQSYEGSVKVNHLDLYRLASFAREDLADFETFFESDAITFIEWPEKAEPYLENPKVVISLEHIDRHSRRIEFQSDDPQLSRRLEELIAVTGS